jgi:hypothetical protein
MLSAEELLAGSSISFEISVPPEVLSPSGGAGPDAVPSTVRLRPLTVGDLQLIMRAAKESDSLVAALMVQRAMVEPEITIAQTASMHAGLLAYLLDQVNRISGISATEEQMNAGMEAPLSKAAFLLAREFGWTPQQVAELTLGQVLLNLRMLKENGRRGA